MTLEEVDHKFERLYQELPEATAALAREHGAFHRARRIKSVAALLRAVLLYSLCDLPLRTIAGWFTGHGQRLTDEAVRGRLQGCGPWLKAVLGQMLPRPWSTPPAGPTAWRLVLHDGSVVNGPGSQGTDYRLHLSFDPVAQQLGECHVYDVKTGESLKLFQHDERTLVLGDRAYAKAPALLATRQTGAHFCTRMAPSYLVLQDEAGNKIAVAEHLRQAGEEVQVSLAVTIREAKTGATCPAYWHAHRLSAAAANQARRRAKRTSRKNGKTLQQATLLWCDWVLLVTSVPPRELPAPEVFALYRVRWQVELLIKRLKSLLDADALRARAGSPLAEVYLLGKLLYALLLEGRTLERVGHDWLQMLGSRTQTCWRVWQLLAAELKEAVLNTAAWDGLDWDELLPVLGERKRKRRLQLIPAAVVQWLRRKPTVPVPAPGYV